VNVGNKVLIKSKKELLAMNSEYFKNIFNQDFLTSEEGVVNIKCLNDTVTQVFIKFLEYDVVFVPKSFEQEDWI
jgi:hypothetical protein